MQNQRALAPDPVREALPAKAAVLETVTAAENRPLNQSKFANPFH